MNKLLLKPVSSVSGEIKLPGSKSLSNRILLAAALAQGTTQITNLLSSSDVDVMVTALQQLGVDLKQTASDSIKIMGIGGPKFKTPNTLFLGNAGTAMRPLAAVLSLTPGEFSLTGEPRMEERPIADLVEALRPLGAQISYLKTEGYPPLRISGGHLKGGETWVNGNISSQFLTGLLMALPLAQENSRILIKGELVSRPYIDMTIQILHRFGIDIQHNDYMEFMVKGNQQYISPVEVLVEGDASSASYFLAAAAIKGGSVKVHGAGLQSLQGDALFARVLGKMGAKVAYGPHWIQVVGGAELHGVDVDLNEMPDAAMTLATTALFAKGETLIRNIGNWRVKETDRLSAMATELRKVGAQVEEGPDYLKITPPNKLQHAEIATYNDHRMAMCFSLLCLGDAGITILEPDVTVKTFPDYFNQLASLCK